MTVPKCHYCEHEGHTNDHVIPRSIGGPSKSWNIVDACIECNAAKADMTYEEFTGLDRLPQACADVGFPTTASFRLFALQLWKVYGTDIRRSQSKPPLPRHLQPKVQPPKHVAQVGPCDHDGPCKGQYGCRLPRVG